MADRSGAWFLELILNVLLLGAIAFVTFAARGEQERGVAVPLFAAVSPASSSAYKPAATPNDAPAVDVKTALNNVKNAADQTANQVNQGFNQAWGSLQIWAAGLDGKISQDELNKIINSIQTGWNGSVSPKDFLKSVNDRINQGQAEKVIQESLQTIATQANEKKTLVINSVVQFMRDNGITWEQTQQVLSKWVTETLKLKPLDFWPKS